MFIRFLKAMLVAFLVATSSLPATDAAADGEMLGTWKLIPAWSPGPTTLELFADHGSLGGFPVWGTVNQTTGEVHLQGWFQGWGDCSVPIRLDGWITLDGRSLEATVGWADNGGYGASCFSSPNSVQGTRCGNGIIDSWEDCDHTGLSDCCTSDTCTFEAQGASCNTVDGNVCTDDICDGAGTCQAFSNTAACTPEGNCGTGLCTAGACELVEPFPAGTSCDLDWNDCTPDTCNGAGECSAAPEIDCAPCADRCYHSYGCIVHLPSDNVEPCDQTLSASIDVQTSEDSAGSIKWKMRGDVASADLGDPASATSYTLCLARFLSYGGLNDDGTGYPVGQITIPADDGCEDEDCWKPLTDGFSYRNRGASGSGALRARFNSKGLRIRAEGEPVTLPTPLPGPFTPTPIEWRYLSKLVASKGSSRSCWAQAVTPVIDTPDRFKGRGRPEAP
jgi:hypothetical protein